MLRPLLAAALCIALSSSIAISAPAKRKVHADGGACVCGFNPRESCDAGNYKHSVSDCYDTDTNAFCGYDDQVIGRCDDSARRRVMRKPVRQHDRISRSEGPWKLCTPLNFVGMAACAVAQNSTCAFRDGGSYPTKQEACAAAQNDDNAPYCTNGTLGCQP